MAIKEIYEVTPPPNTRLKEGQKGFVASGVEPSTDGINDLLHQAEKLGSPAAQQPDIIYMNNHDYGHHPNWAQRHPTTGEDVEFDIMESLPDGMMLGGQKKDEVPVTQPSRRASERHLYGPMAPNGLLGTPWQKSTDRSQ